MIPSASCTDLIIHVFYYLYYFHIDSGNRLNIAVKNLLDMVASVTNQV